MFRFVVLLVFVIDPIVVVKLLQNFKNKVFAFSFHFLNKISSPSPSQHATHSTGVWAVPRSVTVNL